MASDGVYFDSDCKLMLHLDGTDGSTTITDSSLSARSVTAQANAQIDTAQSVFGGASLVLDGTDDYVSFVDSEDFNFGSGFFTVDFRVRFSSFVNQGNDGFHTFYIQSAVGGANSIQLDYKSSTNEIRFITYVSGSVGGVNSQSWSPSINTWYHLAFVRHSGGLSIFVDGTELGSPVAFASTIDNGAGDIAIGLRNGAAVDREVVGWIDEFRVVKGTAVWTSNFTIPSAAYLPFQQQTGFYNLPLLGVG